MKIREIVRAINNLELGATAIYGYSDTKDSGIYVTNTLTKETSKHSTGERIQILICIKNVEKGYLECRDMAEKIRARLEELNCYNITESYIGEYNNKHSYSINLSVGGI
ncbi:hypothetical protein [Fusobacterium varium]|uniref:hypothetical protein n=1 Tax=Fusobacterium varium TaxID=856 RepID=UPI003564C3C2